jgi:dihydroxyacetone kinase-like predicted kinase
MNPSVAELAEAIAAANAHRVVVLPNDPNAILAARQAARLADPTAEVIETRSVPQGMAALVAFEPAAEPERVMEQMRESAAQAHAIEVTRATRPATIEGTRVAPGDVVALVDGRLVGRGDDVGSAVEAAARRLEAVGIFTVYVGESAEPAQTEHVVAALRRAHPGAEAVEVKEGGQPHYPYLIQAE